MDISEFYKRFSSDTTAGSANQMLYSFSEYQRFTGRVAYKLTAGGENYSLLFSNAVDSTYESGQYSTANDIAEPWVIHQLKVGLSSAFNELPSSFSLLTFDGKEEREVKGNDVFCTDPILLNGSKGDYLHIEMTFSGKCIPCHREINLSVKKINEGEFVEDNTMPVPLMIGSDRRVEKRIGFIGDSITQGLGTPMESYKHWVAQICEEFDEKVSVWDLGIGYARAYDAASDGGWLQRAKMCDEVNVCFGVNDIIFGRNYDEVIGDLEKINGLLKTAGCKTIIFTVPPFDFKDEKRETWEKVNKYIRETLSLKADGFFDFAKYVCCDAPNDNLAKYGGHPDVEGSTVIANAYIKDMLK